MKGNSNYIFLLFLFFFACTREKKQELISTEKNIAVETEAVTVSQDSISLPSVNPATAPEMLSISEGAAIPYENNVHPLQQPTVITLGENYFKEHKVSITILPAITAAAGRTVACNLPEPKPAGEMRFKDNASFNIQYLDVAQGLERSYVNELFEDHTGNIWINTKGVITRYNGRSFVNFSEMNKVIGKYPLLKEDKKGNIWMATRNGLIEYNGKFFTVYDTLGGLPAMDVSALEFDKEGNIWIGTPKGITKFDGNKFYTYSKEHGVRGGWITSMQFDKSGQLWFGTTDAGVFCFTANSIVNISTKEGLPSNFILAMAVDKIGNVWICGTGMQKITGSTIEIYDQKQGLINGNTRNLIVDRENNIWCSAYRGGMSCFDGKNFTWYTEKEGLSISTVDCLMEDHNGNIWAGTDGGGLCKFTPRSFNHFIPSRGFKAIIMSVCEDDNKNIWLGSYDEGLFKYDGSNILAINDKARAIGTVLFMFRDKKNAIWMNAASGGTIKYDGKSFVRYRKEQGLFSNDVGGMMQDREGNIWFGTGSEGAMKFDGKQFTRYNKDQGLLSNTVGHIAQDQKGNIWFATAAGINKLEEGVMRSFTDTNGLPRKNIKNLTIDKAGNIWVGTVGNGLYRYDGKYVMKLTKEQGLSDNIIRSIIEDKEWNVRSGYSGVWVSTDNGIDHITIKDKSNSLKDVQIITYGRQDGLRGEDFCSNSGLMDSRGRAWWGSVKGLTTLQTNNLQTDVDTPKIKLDDINLEQNYIDFNALEDSIKHGKAWFIGEKEKRDLTKIRFSGTHPFGNYPLDLELPYNINNVTFNFSAISWLGGHKIKYQYVLDGSDKEWHPVTSETKAIYTSLLPGTYTFKVKAKGVTEKWSQPLEYTFVVRPPWWKTIWAYLLYAFIFISVTLIYLNSRTKALRKRQKELEQTVIERTADVVDEKNKVEEKNRIIEIKQKEILDSITYAENIQRTLLANHDFVNETIPESFVFFKPKDIVSGDFYWATKVDDLFYLAVCDSTGHGVPGAFMSLLNISFLNEAINEKNIYEPQKVFDHVRQRLIDNISQNGRKDGMDGILLCFNMKKNSISYAASNNAPILISGGELTHLPMDKMPIGSGDRNEPFKQFDIPYKKGDMLYVFTDGYADQFGGPKGKKFMTKQLQEILFENYKAPLGEQEKMIRTAFEKWKGDLEQVDDVCIIGIRL